VEVEVEVEETHLAFRFCKVILTYRDFARRRHDTDICFSLSWIYVCQAEKLAAIQVQGLISIGSGQFKDLNTEQFQSTILTTMKSAPLGFLCIYEYSFSSSVKKHIDHSNMLQFKRSAQEIYRGGRWPILGQGLWPWICIIYTILCRYRIISLAY